MDPVSASGIALSVIGLFPLCVQGFEMIQDGLDAPRDMRKGLGMIIIQSGAFAAWGQYWGIGERSLRGSKNPQSALEEYIRTSGKLVGDGVLTALIFISNTFANVRELEKKYGIKIKTDPGREVKIEELDAAKIIQGQIPILGPKEMEERKEHMNILRRAKFVLKDGKGLKELGIELETYVNALRNTCPESAVEKIKRAMVYQVVMPNERARDLDEVVQAAQESSQKEQTPGERAVYDLIASTAAFKVRNQRTHTIGVYPLEDYMLAPQSARDQQTNRWMYNDGDGTMAISIRKNYARFVEWKYYATDNEADRADNIKDIEKLASMLCDPQKPREIRTLNCIGIIHDRSRFRYGFLYQPPAYIEVLPARWNRGEISEMRKPVSLLQLLQNSSERVLDLGVRFHLAKQLVQSIYILHAAGWVHKNIRSSSILFLPAESTDGGPSKSGRKSYETPWLCGFGQSRSENIVQDRGPPMSHYYDDEETFTKYNIKLDIYQHPDKRMDLNRRYSPNYDIYSLGCVLLEIGLWQSLDTFSRDSYGPEEFRSVLLGLVNELVGQVGSKYASAVKECLSISSVDGLSGRDEAQYILCWKVAAVLDKCSA